MYTCRDQRKTSGPRSVTPLSELGSFTSLELEIGCQQVPAILLSPFPTAREIQVCIQPHPAFYVSAKDLNPGPHAHTTSILTTELSLSPSSTHPLSLSFPPSIHAPSFSSFPPFFPTGIFDVICLLQITQHFLTVTLGNLEVPYLPLSVFLTLPLSEKVSLNLSLKS